MSARLFHAELADTQVSVSDGGSRSGRSSASSPRSGPPSSTPTAATMCTRTTATCMTPPSWPPAVFRASTATRPRPATSTSGRPDSSGSTSGWSASSRSSAPTAPRSRSVDTCRRTFCARRPATGVGSARRGTPSRWRSSATARQRPSRSRPPPPARTPRDRGQCLLTPHATPRVLVTGAGGPSGVCLLRALAERPVTLLAGDIDPYAAGLYLVAPTDA